MKNIIAATVVLVLSASASAQTRIATAAEYAEYKANEASYVSTKDNKVVINAPKEEKQQGCNIRDENGKVIGYSTSCSTNK